MNEIFELVKNLAIFATMVTVSTDNIEQLLKPYFSITNYKLSVAFALTVVGVVGLNVGIMESIGIITQSSLSFIHEVDIIFTVLILLTGAQGLHKLADLIVNLTLNGFKGSKGE